MSSDRPPADILKLNAWIKDYARNAGAIYADYFSVLVNAEGALKVELSVDGLHPNAKGCALMAPIASAAIERALR